ncbi:MAG: glycosyltransferase family 2 protein [Pseudomonadota bacterium]
MGHRAPSQQPVPAYRRMNPLRRPDNPDHVAVYGLIDKAPDASAHRVLNRNQWVWLFGLITLLITGLVLAPLTTLIAANILATVYFLLAIGFRVLLFALAFFDPLHEEENRTRPAADNNDTPLPIITILLPVFREAKSLVILSQSIAALDYPSEKMDVKLLIEEEDEDTRAEAKRLNLHAQWDVVTIPKGYPQTKPKACNYGLHRAAGSLIVIYDAEDQPQTDQLRCATAIFTSAQQVEAANPEAKPLACAQARLNFYNASETWLTRFFALEYALWFDTLLPALEKLDVPIPLGGTSNFFRTDILRDLGGWDPFNVTEDADLGLRLAAQGFRTQIMPSTTYEEANCRVGNWMRQRSRWMKGYMQTWLVHMRQPVRFARATGVKGFVTTQLFVGGNVISAVINPILWVFFLAWHLFEPAFVARIFPEPLMSLNLFAFLFGNCFFVYLFLMAPLKRGWLSLCSQALFVPVYWSLTALAAYKGLWQLIRRPHFWEKTDHMLSPQAQAQRAGALARLEPDQEQTRRDALVEEGRIDAAA